MKPTKNIIIKNDNFDFFRKESMERKTEFQVRKEKNESAQNVSQVVNRIRLL